MATKAAKDSKSVFEIVSEQVLELLDKGVAPWRKPWTCRQPMNGISKKPYRGLNALMTGLAPYSDPRWLTFKQISEKGGRVKKGERSTLVTYWKWLEKKQEDGTVESIPMLRFYLVFNLEQTEGVNLPALEQGEAKAMPEVEALVDAYRAKGGPSLRFGGDRACYSPLLDHIQMPSREQFDTNEAFAATLLHESGHSTGHATRLGRFGAIPAPHGVEEYCFEELVAEMFVAMAAASLDLDLNLEQSAAYIDHWRKAIKGDKRLVVKAAGAAQKALDLFLGVQAESKAEEPAAA